MEDSADLTTSPDSESHEGKGPSSRIKLNHHPEDIMGNLNELALRKRTVDKCVANFLSYSCYLLQVEPTKLKKLFKMKFGLKQCMMIYFSLKGMTFGPWNLDQRMNTSLVQSGISPLKLMRRRNVIRNKARLVAQ